MITISLCMIVKNEEEVLASCLDSVHEICDEIIIVDTGSTDKTKEVAQQYTSNIYDYKWMDDFSAARNFAFSKATMDFIFWLDADDIVLEQDQYHLKELKEQLDPDTDAVSMNYILTYDEYGNPAFYFRRHRLVKRSNNFQWIGAVHEYLQIGGKILEADIAIVHRKDEKKHTHGSTDRNLKIYENRLKKGDKFTPRDLYYYANELKDHKQFDKAILYYQLFLENKAGWVEDKIRACLNLADIYNHNKEDAYRLEIILKTFTYDIPRPEACCKLGDYFTEKKLHQLAIHWYKRALEINYIPQGFHFEAYETWYPHLSLCAVYWKIGKYDKSLEHHEIVKEMRPNDPKILYNENLFVQTGKKSGVIANEN